MAMIDIPPRAPSSDGLGDYYNDLHQAYMELKKKLYEESVPKTGSVFEKMPLTQEGLEYNAGLPQRAAFGAIEQLAGGVPGSVQQGMNWMSSFPMMPIAYHGSPVQGITEFKGDRGVAWFTPNKNYAKEYARGPKGTIYKADLDIKNPLDIQRINLSKEGNELTLADSLRKHGHGWLADVVEDGYRNGLLDDLGEHGILADAFTQKPILDAIRAKGYDGVIAKEGVNKSYLVFDPKQARLINDKDVKILERK